MFLGSSSNLKWSADLTSSGSRGALARAHTGRLFSFHSEERREEVKEGEGKEGEGKEGEGEEGEGKEEEGRGKTRGGTEHRNSLFDPLTSLGWQSSPALCQGAPKGPYDG